jgi:hypothetical protein
LLLLASCATQDDASRSGLITLTVIGTNDVHGALLPKQFNGGLAALSGYVAAVRAARAEDGGAVLLIDAGDMWQGSLESNLVEGKTVLDAYNALGYTAATIGNHELISARSANWRFRPAARMTRAAHCGNALRRRSFRFSAPTSLTPRQASSSTGKMLRRQ